MTPPTITDFKFEGNTLTVSLHADDIAIALALIGVFARTLEAIGEAEAGSQASQPQNGVNAPAAPSAEPARRATVTVAPEVQEEAAKQAASGPDEIITEQTEVGPVRVLKRAGIYTAEFNSELGQFSHTAGNHDAAIGELLDKVRKARRAAAKAQPAAEPAAAPVATPPATPTAIPPELANAVNFRDVIHWMLRNGFTTPEAVVAKCTEFRAGMPVLQRIGGDAAALTERVTRALKVAETQAN